MKSKGFHALRDRLRSGLRCTRHRLKGSWQSDPILGPQSRHAAELAHVVGDDDQSFAAGMTADLHVMRAADRPRTFQFRSNLSVVCSRLGLERQYLEARREMLDRDQVVGPARRFLS